MFCGGLHKETTSQSLREYFVEFGEVEEAIVMIDGVTKESRGFGFVTFASVEDMKNCLQNSPHTIDKKQVCG